MSASTAAAQPPTSRSRTLLVQQPPPTSPTPVLTTSPTNNILLLHGPLSCKKRSLGSFQPKYAYLVHPNSVKDVESLFMDILETPAWTIKSEEGLKCLGHLTKAAVNGSPLLILLTPPPPRSRNPPALNDAIYIHLTDVLSISTESDLHQPCHFSLHTTAYSNGACWRFSARNSVEYTEWTEVLSGVLPKGAEARELGIAHVAIQMERDKERKANPSAAAAPAIPLQSPNSSIAGAGMLVSPLTPTLSSSPHPNQPPSITDTELVDTSTLRWISTLSSRTPPPPTPPASLPDSTLSSSSSFPNINPAVASSVSVSSASSPTFAPQGLTGAPWGRRNQGGSFSSQVSNQQQQLQREQGHGGVVGQEVSKQQQEEEEGGGGGGEEEGVLCTGSGSGGSATVAVESKTEEKNGEAEETLEDDEKKENVHEEIFETKEDGMASASVENSNLIES
ncbi:hypothetical protein HDV05_001605 [Chytridiales sp. JEL 0842]|nr:hypothetical protein HDV05_001605 [Chytridiales sp. JEL 0842]